MHRSTSVLVPTTSSLLNSPKHVPPPTVCSIPPHLPPSAAVQRSSNSLGWLKARAANPVEPFLSGKFEYGMGRPAKRRTVFMFMRKGHWADHPVMAPAFLGTHRTSGGGRLGPLPVTQSVASTPGVVGGGRATVGWMRRMALHVSQRTPHPQPPTKNSRPL